ncbi:Hypothetical_protein [Hexamita inflata]|uniref:Hypothetical_protein n=1 Tax=Hexamita inflata TaxID=28002 RepID=A0AA86UIR7_9EUKA|nr:Hypothetical protein HINF_LOCUS40412 [Hexamita inflata]
MPTRQAGVCPRFRRLQLHGQQNILMNTKSHHQTFSKARPVEVIHVVVAVYSVGERRLALLRFGFARAAGVAGLHARIMLVHNRFFVEAVVAGLLRKTVLTCVESLLHSWLCPYLDLYFRASFQAQTIKIKQFIYFLYNINVLYSYLYIGNQDINN